MTTACHMERGKCSKTHRLFGRSEDLLDHHAVPGKGASIQGVGPIRTEGA